MSFMGLIFFFFPEQIMSIFIDDPMVIRLGVWPLRLVAFSQPMLATMMVFAGALRGAGDTRRDPWHHGCGFVAGAGAAGIPVDANPGPGRRMDRDGG